MAVTYSRTSPYANTPSFGSFLDLATIPTFPFDVGDVAYEIDNIYNNRPDLLAFDLYGDTGLWWVFSVRNPNVLQDPLFDFKAGTLIYIPQKQNLVTALGL
jgi:hypothetical protein